VSTDTHEPVTLRIFRTPSGQWAGHLIVGVSDLGSFSGYGSPEAVEEAARETGVYPDRIEVY
jgi:hypothetical protein